MKVVFIEYRDGPWMSAIQIEVRVHATNLEDQLDEFIDVFEDEDILRRRPCGVSLMAHNVRTLQGEHSDHSLEERVVRISEVLELVERGHSGIKCVEPGIRMHTFEGKPSLAKVVLHSLKSGARVGARKCCLEQHFNCVMEQVGGYRKLLREREETPANVVVHTATTEVCFRLCPRLSGTSARPEGTSNERQEALEPGEERSYKPMRHSKPPNVRHHARASSHVA